MKYVIEWNAARCVACGACAVACMDQNDIEPQKGEAPFRRCVETEEGAGKTARIRYASIGCLHCADAPCIAACPAGCLKNDPDTGFVICDNSACTGCRACEAACPVGAPTFDADGRMRKCDGCNERVKAGLEPACVRVCPFGALRLEVLGGSIVEAGSARAAERTP